MCRRCGAIAANGHCRHCLHRSGRPLRPVQNMTKIDISRMKLAREILWAVLGGRPTALSLKWTVLTDEAAERGEECVASVYQQRKRRQRRKQSERERKSGTTIGRGNQFAKLRLFFPFFLFNFFKNFNAR